MALEDGGRELLLLPPKQTETMSGDFVCFWPKTVIYGPWNWLLEYTICQHSVGSRFSMDVEL